MNRSQRCGVCAGCQARPCGACVYCQDSPQFGGPGVKKQSCIERRCLRVLENRLQRDAPTFKAKAGCLQCDDCRTMDCYACLVCLDKKFFGNRYLPMAMCAKKRCNNARPIDVPNTGFMPTAFLTHQDPTRYMHSQHHIHHLQHRPVDGVFAQVFDRNPTSSPTSGLKRHHMFTSVPPPPDIHEIRAKHARMMAIGLQNNSLAAAAQHDKSPPSYLAGPPPFVHIAPSSMQYAGYPPAPQFMQPHFDYAQRCAHHAPAHHEGLLMPSHSGYTQHMHADDNVDDLISAALDADDENNSPPMGATTMTVDQSTSSSYSKPTHEATVEENPFATWSPYCDSTDDFEDSINGTHSQNSSSSGSSEPLTYLDAHSMPPTLMAAGQNCVLQQL